MAQWVVRGADAGQSVFRKIEPVQESGDTGDSAVFLLLPEKETFWHICLVR